jgi:hypothetical protein
MPEGKNAHDRFQLFPPREAAISVEHSSDRLVAYRISIVSVSNILSDLTR